MDCLNIAKGLLGDCVRIGKSLFLIYFGNIWHPGSFSGFGQLSSFEDYAKEWILSILHTSGLQGLIFRVWQASKLGPFEDYAKE